MREFKTREFKSARKIVLRQFKYTLDSCQPSRIQRDNPALRHPVPCPARIGQIQANVPHFQQFSHRIYLSIRIYRKNLQPNDISASDW